MIPFAVVTMTIAGIIGTATLLGAHDWLPKLLKRDTNPPESYVWGIALGILPPFLGWLAFWWAFYGPNVPAWLAGLAFIVITTFAGSGTLGAYRLDHNHSAHLQDALHHSRVDIARQMLADIEEDLQAGLPIDDTLRELRQTLAHDHRQP